MTLSTLPDGPMPATRPYHHGDLRNACISCALELLEDEGLNGLTLRAVGQRAGVSRTAPYRHFSTKRDLLAATAAAGFRLLTEKLQAAIQSKPAGSINGLVASGMAYCDFATTYPCLYRLMFAGDLGKGPLFDHEEIEDFSDREFPELAETGSECYMALVDSLTRAQESGSIRSRPPREQALMLWSALHGLISLYLDNRRGYAEHDATALKQVAGNIIEISLQGLQA